MRLQLNISKCIGSYDAIFMRGLKNPSTLYSSARIPRKAVENARDMVAKAIGAFSDEIIFTSGGTEGDNWAIKNMLFSQYGCKNKIITSSIKHHVILNLCKVLEKLGVEVIFLSIDREGIINNFGRYIGVNTENGQG